MKLLDKIFSVEYCKTNYFTSKIINLFGIKLKFKKINKFDIEQIIINSSILKAVNFLFCLSNSAEDDLFSISNEAICIIVHKNCIQADIKFIIDFIINAFWGNLFIINKLNKDSFLYKEHIERVKNNEYIWKYADRKYLIAYTYLKKDSETNEFTIIKSSIPESQYAENNTKLQYLTDTIQHKFIEGITLKEYFDKQNFKKQIEIADKVLNWLFTEFKSENNPLKVSGKVFDCHLCNIILGADSKLHFIDFDVIYLEDLERSFCIYKMFFDYNEKVYYEMLKRYKCKDKHKLYSKMFELPVFDDNNLSECHKELVKKYFINSEIPQSYTLNYEKKEIIL